MKKITGFYPFWFWNDYLTESEIRWQICEMADKGVKGFYIHSRQGLGQPYLSESFMDMVAVAINEAEKHGLKVHLYDEYPYPSGVAGGEVVLGNPEFLETVLTQQQFELEAGHQRVSLPAGKVLNCTGFPVANGQPKWEHGRDLSPYIGMHLGDESYNETGLTSYNRKRYFASNPKPTLDINLAEKMLISVSVQYIKTDFKYWGYYVDALNPEAIREFIRLTHERYYAKFATKFGTTIQSIFVDETCPHWSRLIPDAYQQKYGDNLLELLPALHLGSHPLHQQTVTNLEILKYEMFCESFEKPISSWCREHKICYAAEKPGLRFSQQNYMDIPGCDPGHTKAGDKPDVLTPKIRSNARAVASAAYFYDKPASLCECYHSLGWSATLQDAKLIAENLLLLGIDMLVPHGFFYSTHALKKHDAPPTFFFQMPYWHFFGKLSDQVLRISQLLEGTHINAKVLVVDPWSGLRQHPGNAYLNPYQHILDTLIENHIEFLIGDTDILAGGNIVDSRLNVKELAFDTIIVPPMHWREQELESELQTLAAGNVNVIEIEANAERDVISKRLTEFCRASLEFDTISGESEKLMIVNRSNDNKNLYFITNNSNDDVCIALKNSDFSIISLADDDAFQNGSQLTLAPYESLMLSDCPGVGQKHIETVSIDLPESFSVKLHNKNLYRLYDWQLSVNGSGEYRPVQAVPLINQLDASGTPFCPKFSYRFGQVPDIGLPEMTLSYQFDFNLDVETGIQLVMEPGSIVGDWTITVNDGQPFSRDDFSESDSHIRGSLEHDISSYLKMGKNVIDVTVKTNRGDGGLLNALYLAGDLGVNQTAKTLIELPESIAFEDYESAGLPHFAGCIEYQAPIELNDIPESETVNLEINFPKRFQESCEIALNDSDWLPSCWNPRRVRISSKHLKKQDNLLKIRVYTSLSRSFEGR